MCACVCACVCVCVCACVCVGVPINIIDSSQAPSHQEPDADNCMMGSHTVTAGSLRSQERCTVTVYLMNTTTKDSETAKHRRGYNGYGFCRHCNSPLVWCKQIFHKVCNFNVAQLNSCYRHTNGQFGRLEKWTYI